MPISTIPVDLMHIVYTSIVLHKKHLNIPLENKFRVALSHFRTSSHDLNVETGRYKNSPRNQKLCKSCNIRSRTNSIVYLHALSIIISEINT